MRAELPWNVAGIPPEAREAARAAARREGLSVGEWLTRRILRSFSDLGEEREAMPPLDSWGLPQSAASRRDTDDMLARVSRSETESGDAYRRIEEQLRGVARRLDSSERSQSESNRVLSRTAAEMNIAAREQTQVFDQVGQSVVAINKRLEALEHARAQDGLKDAVKGLHLGLSRLADQITATANQSASQISMVAGNLEQVATQLVEVRADSENSARALDQRLGAVERVAHSGADAIDNAVARLEQRLEHRLGTIEKSTGEVIGHGLENLERRLGLVETAGEQTVPGLERLEQRLGAVEKAAEEQIGPGLEVLDQRLGSVEQAASEILGAGLEKLERRLGLVEKTAAENPGPENLEHRLGAVEKSAQIGAEAIDHALDKLDSHANERAGDRAEFERHAGHMQDALARLEEWIGRLEQRAAEQAAPARPAQDDETSGRLDSIERALTDLVSRLAEAHPAAALEDGLHTLAGRIDSLEKNHEELLDELRAGREHSAAPQPPPAFPPPVFAPPVFAPPEPMADPYASMPVPESETPVSVLPFQAVDEAPPFAEPPSMLAEPQDSFADLGLTPGPGFADDVPQEESDPFASYDPTGAEADPPENFLSAARRSARAASEKAESEKRGLLGGFAWANETGESDASPRPRFLILGVFGGIVVLVLAAGLVLSQRLHAPRADVVRSFPAAKQRAPLPAVTTPALTLAKPSLPAAALANPHTRGTKTAPAPQQRGARLSPIQPALPATALAQKPLSKPSGAAKTLDRATQLANSGNALAQTIIGLRDLDGTGGAQVNAAQAAKWLGLAAARGQPVAQYRLGTLVERGQGAAADPAKAVHWYLAAANQGNRKAMHNLAVAYAEGAGAKRNMAEAARWFAKAAGLGLSDSQFNLAVLYERGDGVPQSLVDAYKWYAIAAAQGDAESRQRLSVLQTQLGAADRAAAQRSAGSFHAAPLDRAANVPPEMGDLKN